MKHPRTSSTSLPVGPWIMVLLAAALLVPGAAAQSIAIVPRDIEFHFDGVDYARDGRLYFGGSWKGGEVFRCTPGGEIEVYAKGFNGPTDTVMDSHGNVYVSNYNGTTISMITPEREVRTFANVPQGPAGMAIDGNDNLYVTIYGLPMGDGNQLLRITPAGEVSTYLQTPDIQASVGLAIDDKGVLYVANGHDGRIYKVPEAGRHELLASLPLAFGKGAGGHLDWAGGNLFASSGIGAVYRIAPNGVMHTLMQNGEQRTRQGPPVSKLIDGCNGLAAAPDGRTLYLGCAPDGKRALVRLDLDGAAPGSRLQDGWEAIQAGEFERAQRIFDQLAQSNPPQEGALFGLGSLHYRKREFAQAAADFERAADAPQLRAAASYNGACSYALAGDVDRAYDTLTRAIEAGYADLANLNADADLASLRDDPRWAGLVEVLEANGG